MTIQNSLPQRFSRIALFCLAASALLPMAAHAGGRGAGGTNAARPAVTQEADRLQRRLLALESRVEELENQAVKEIASSDSQTVVVRGKGRRSAQLPQVADGN